MGKEIAAKVPRSPRVRHTKHKVKHHKKHTLIKLAKIKIKQMLKQQGKTNKIQSESPIKDNSSSSKLCRSDGNGKIYLR